MHLVPLKVKIGLKENRHAKYPTFNLISSNKRGNTDWSYYVDSVGGGWHYDKLGHQSARSDGDEWDSPSGEQWGCLLVDEDFANEAVSLFPSECQIIDEARFEDFHDNKAHAHEPDVKVDEEALKEFTVKESMRVTLDVVDETRKAKALDPDDDTPGITRNKKKKWATLKALNGYEVKPGLAKK